MLVELLAAGSVLFMLSVSYLVALRLLAMELTFERKPLYASTDERIVPAIVHALQIGDAKHFVDLGCGDGRVLMAVRGAYPQCAAEGCETALLPYLLGKFSALFSSGVRVRRQDLFSVDLSKTMRVYANLPVESIAKLEPVLAAQLAPGSVFVSYDAALPNTSARHEFDLEFSDATAGHKLYVYEY